MKMSAEQQKNFRDGLKFRSKRHAHKKGMGNWTQCTTKAWTGCTSAAMEALQEMDSAERKLASMGVMLLLSVLMASGQTLYVIADTNDLKRIPSNVKIVAMTNLSVNQTFTEVVTNRAMVGPPIEVKDTNGVVIARRIYQVSSLMTNQYRVYEETNYVIQSRKDGPILETSYYDIPPALPNLPVVMQLRQQR